MINALLSGTLIPGVAGYATAQDVSMTPPTVIQAKAGNSIGGGHSVAAFESAAAASEGGYTHTTKLGDVVTRDFYDRQGKRLYSIAYYGEKGLPAGIRVQVRSVYFDFTIQTVEEVRLADKKIYLIDIRDDKTLKTIRYCEGDMDEVNELDRAD